MKFYQLTCLISPEISEQKLITLQEKIVSFLQEEKGILGKMENPIKRRLAYPIRKQTQAFLFLLEFQLNPENLENLQKKLKAEESILRYDISAKKMTAASEVKKPQRRILPKISTVPKEEKVELKEIEKKLEEILGQ